MIQAIQTEYKGILYRSRTEARWAVFMDKAGVPFHYEMEGFDLGDGIRYLPDFFLPNQDAWLEIKGVDLTTIEETKAEQLCFKTGKQVFTIVGPPSASCMKRGFARVIFPPCEGTEGQLAYDDSRQWCECPHCGRVELHFDGRAERIGCQCPRDGSEICGFESPKLVAAYQAAVRERFGT